MSHFNKHSDRSPGDDVSGGSGGSRTSTSASTSTASAATSAGSSAAARLDELKVRLHSLRRDRDHLRGLRRDAEAAVRRHRGDLAQLAAREQSARRAAEDATRAELQAALEAQAALLERLRAGRAEEEKALRRRLREARECGSAGAAALEAEVAALRGDWAAAHVALREACAGQLGAEEDLRRALLEQAQLQEELESAKRSRLAAASAGGEEAAWGGGADPREERYASDSEADSGDDGDDYHHHQRGGRCAGSPQRRRWARRSCGCEACRRLFLPSSGVISGDCCEAATHHALALLSYHERQRYLSPDSAKQQRQHSRPSPRRHHSRGKSASRGGAGGSCTRHRHDGKSSYAPQTFGSHISAAAAARTHHSDHCTSSASAAAPPHAARHPDSLITGGNTTPVSGAGRVCSALTRDNPTESPRTRALRAAHESLARELAALEDEYDGCRADLRDPAADTVAASQRMRQLLPALERKRRQLAVLAGRVAEADARAARLWDVLARQEEEEEERRRRTQGRGGAGRQRPCGEVYRTLIEVVRSAPPPPPHSQQQPHTLSSLAGGRQPSSRRVP